MSSIMKIVLEDLLRRDWKQQLLRYPLPEGAPEKGDLHAQDNGQDVPAQRWSDPAGNPHVCFIADLPPLDRRELAILPGASATASDLEILQNASSATVRTSRFGLELPLGTFQGDAIPAPITRMTWTDGTAFGGSRWFGEAPVRLESHLTARGPVLAEIRMRWAWSDGAEGTLRLELAAGDSRAYWESWSSGDHPERGWDLSISGLGPLILHQVGGKKWKDTWGIAPGAVGDVSLDDKWVGMLTTLSPWRDWWDDQAQLHWRFKTDKRGMVLQADSCQSGDWVEPDPPGTRASWNKRLRKHLPLHRGEDGDIFLRIDQADGWRKWFFGASGPSSGRHLNEVNGYDLEWPEGRRHPFLFLTEMEIAERRKPIDDPEVQALLAHADEDMDAPYQYGHGPGNDHLQNAGDDKAINAWLLTGSREVADRVHLVERLRRRLNWLGRFDLMRYVAKIALFYDLVVDSDLVDPAERRVFRAQMAYLGYKLADPRTWSMERGYRSGPVNMSVSYILNLGMVACALPDHPAAKGWSDYATARYRQWMAEHVGPKGEWPESMHYTHVSTNEFLNYAIAARNAGLADLLAEGILKRVMIYAAKLHAPPDPRGTKVEGPVLNFACRPKDTRGTVPLGRAASTGGSFGHYGLLARATATSDPAFSRVMQWLYRENGWNENYSNESVDAIRCVYPDRRLPAECPDWHSERFSTAIVMRERTGASDEDYLIFDAGAPYTSPGEQGGLMLWFWRGVPVMSRFSGGYDERAEALISGVSRAVPRRPDTPWSDVGDHRTTEFSTQRACDFAVMEGERGAAQDQLHDYPPEFPAWPAYQQTASASGILYWRRQVLYAKNVPGGPVLFLRDSVRGEPGGWKLWTLASEIAPSGDAAPAAEGPLPGNAFTAKGHFGVDMDIHLAAPVSPRCAAVRYRREYSYAKKLLQGFVDDQTLLHVEIPEGQACFAALAPRPRETAKAAMDTLGDGRIIRLRRSEETLFAILADRDAEVRADAIHCRGSAGLIHQRADALTLTLPAAGALRFGEYGITSAGPVELCVSEDTITARIPAEKGMRILDIEAPGEWELRVSSSSFLDPRLFRVGDLWRLQLVPEVVTSATLHRK